MTENSSWLWPKFMSRMVVRPVARQKRKPACPKMARRSVIEKEDPRRQMDGRLGGDGLSDGHFGDSDEIPPELGKQEAPSSGQEDLKPLAHYEVLLDEE